jgi:uncharacterized protein YbjQ (UPF0145 family)
MLCVTTNDIPGWEIQRVCGEVFGVTVRSRNAFSQIGAGFKSMVGGELAGMTKNVIDSRNEAMTRLFAEAQARGGNALVAMRFDTTELGNNWTEICAYGTAVVAIPVTEAARQTAIQLGYGQPAQQQPVQQQAAQQSAQGWPGRQPAEQQWSEPSQQWSQPTQQPPAHQPTQQPPAEQPATQQWFQPAEQQPGYQPTVQQPPEHQPTIQQPPTEQPPAQG